MQKLRIGGISAFVAVILFFVICALYWPILSDQIWPHCEKDPAMLSACATIGQAFFSAVALIIAIGVPAWQTWRAQQMQRNSLKPRLGFEWLYQRDSPNVVLKLRNSGLGPAVVDKFIVKIDGKVFERPTSVLWEAALSSLTLPTATYSGSVLERGSTFGVGEERIILEYKYGDVPPKLKLELEEQFERVSVEICYRSFFEDKFFVATNFPHEG